MAFLVSIFVPLSGSAIADAGTPQSSARNWYKAPLLGSKDFAGPYGAGFGAIKPKRIYNGGVPSGLVEKIRWRRWGKPVAIGWGLGHGYRPSGGYYAKHIRIKFRAKRIGYCQGSNWPAYTRLLVRAQKKPGGRFGRWFSWSGSSSICEWG
jgi:hypothetical protein